MEARPPGWSEPCGAVHAISRWTARQLLGPRSMTSTPKFGFLVEYVRDMEAAKRFYTEVLGLEPQRVHPSFVQFESFAIASDAPLDKNVHREVYWLVDDAESAFARLSAQTQVTLPLTAKPFGKVFGIRAPSGEPIYVLQLAAERPSRTVD